ncbi:MAG: FadR family transcriptional regulator, partial [Rhizobiales bacterium]|nr:FadR family transcriptional regulator [Hyphomicrobiales bacterium]
MKRQKSASPTLKASQKAWPKAPQKSAPRPLKAPADATRNGTRGSLHRSVAQDIGARILNGEFAPGTLLPNEAEWCKSFGVSRTAVREAIKMLMGKGLIISRPRIGSRVLPRAQWNLLDRDVLGWYVAAAKQSHFLAHMQQVRE